MSINSTEIRIFGAVGGSDREITLGGANVRAFWRSTSGEFLINLAVNPTVFSQGG
jgi:hypothetical protein